MNMSKTKNSHTTPPRDDDETIATLNDILASEGIRPKRSLLNKLLLFWVKSASEAQTRGIRIARQVQKEQKED